MHHNDKSNA